jgi:hypothetical protein
VLEGAHNHRSRRIEQQVGGTTGHPIEIAGSESDDVDPSGHQAGGLIV